MSRRPTARHDAPLLAWGESLRAGRQRRSRLRHIGLVLGAGTILLIGSILHPPTPRLLWNASASAPIGLYRISPDAWLEPGDMAVVRLPEPFRRLAAERRYLPANVPLVKRVAAIGGDEICAFGPHVYLNGEAVARRRSHDPHGRTLPTWDGCTTLRGRQIFLLSRDPLAFDGRYFGVIEGANIIGKAQLLWRR